MAKHTNFDFSGWATKNNLQCSDGRTILKDAFKHNDGQTVPLVWNHQHNEPYNVLGHALLENRDEGVYAWCAFNETETGQAAKQLVSHGDVSALSIYAGQLKQDGPVVKHGSIREVSLVLAGANPGAMIETVFAHADGFDEEAIIYTGENIYLQHADPTPEPAPAKEPAQASEDSRTVNDVIDTLNNEQKDAFETIIASVLAGGFSSEEEKQKALTALDTCNEDQQKAVYFLIDQAFKMEKPSNDDVKHNYEGEEIMKKNIFADDFEEPTLSHADMDVIFSDAKRVGSLRDSINFHAEEGVLCHTVTDDSGNTVTYGIANIDYLFPDAQKISNTPEFYKREDAWVSTVMTGTHHSPFSRIKSIFADITMDEARAKGYVKGNEKTEEVFALLKRTTTPQTIYKKQKLDRDDIIDITDFDVVAWLKSEMRIMLDEEIARAILVGDGRTALHADKIDPSHVRPIWTDDDFYTIKAVVELDDSIEDESAQAKKIIRKIIKSRKDYKGSGNPVLFTTEDFLTDCLLIEDNMGRVIYDTEEKLRTVLRVSKIVTVPVMEGLSRTVATDNGSETRYLKAILVNLNDYNVGADKGGAVNMFDDFDIDFNQEKYLIETRCSGALIRPKSAIAVEAVFQ